MFVAHFPAAVFRGTGTFTLKADRVLDLAAGLRDTLENEIVLPAVTHVVRVRKLELLAAGEQQIAHHGLGRVDHLGTRDRVIELFGDAVALSPDDEIVQMAIGRGGR
jgi:hypothetical protein